MFRRFTKKRFVVALSVVAALAVAGGAIAYFTSSGSGNGSATVGNAAQLSVAADPSSGGPLYPDGTSSVTFGYTVTNNASFAQRIGSTTVTVVADTNGDVKHGTTSVLGCKASWFTASDSGASAAPATLDATGGHSAGTVTVKMPANSTDDQDACQGASPDIKVAANAH